MKKMTTTTTEASKLAGTTMVKLTEENFQAYSNASKPLLVDFWAEWCGPCKVMEPVIERLSRKYADQITFGKVNVDEEMDLSSRFQVFSIPTFMIFKGGNPIDAIIGPDWRERPSQLRERLPRPLLCTRWEVDKSQRADRGLRHRPGYHRGYRGRADEVQADVGC